MTAPALLHLARRFFGALDPRGPGGADEAWVAEVLSAGELGLWRRMSGPDRRHAVGVARAVPERLAPAALLHDVGKIESGLGTLARVPATLVGVVARERAVRGDGRVARYLRHDVLGARLLVAAGASPLVVAWAREHHLPADRWSVDAGDGALLKAADDD
ncbi:MAG TPA: HD domain-containing protein [Acidimicrobiales bacterium]|nr:HD domain-containing protein [Acidimicrobiales bacterium]